MSEFGTIIDALETHWRAAEPTLPAADAGFERVLGNGHDLDADKIPHVFAHDPTEQTVELDLGQQTRAVSVQCDFWADATQESISATLDTFRDRIEADPTLGGIVQWSLVTLRSVVDHESVGKSRRAGVVIVQTRKDV